MARARLNLQGSGAPASEGRTGVRAGAEDRPSSAPVLCGPLSRSAGARPHWGGLVLYSVHHSKCQSPPDTPSQTHSPAIWAPLSPGDKVIHAEYLARGLTVPERSGSHSRGRFCRTADGLNGARAPGETLVSSAPLCGPCPWWRHCEERHSHDFQNPGARTLAGGIMHVTGQRPRHSGRVPYISAKGLRAPQWG